MLIINKIQMKVVSQRVFQSLLNRFVDTTFRGSVMQALGQMCPRKRN
jgi:hypothetical protein